MKIAGIIKNSFVDYPGLISAVVFTQGCNYDCFFCHNRELIPFGGELIDNDDVFAFLKKRIGLIDGVVISGGEPTLQTNLKDFAIGVKELGYKVKLDTNGTRPDVINDLLNSNLIDYIAMDYKAPFDRYDEICCVKCNIDLIKESFKIIKNSGLEYELRTTFVPQLKAFNIEQMLVDLPDIETFSIQKYNMPDKYKSEHKHLIKVKNNSDKELEKAIKIAKKHVKNLIIR